MMFSILALGPARKVRTYLKLCGIARPLNKPLSLPSPPTPSHLPPAPLAMPATTAETLSLVTRNVSVAPLVLLSVADHYGRSAKGTRKRVVGVLLGQNDAKNARVSNSFAGECCLGFNKLAEAALRVAHD